MDHWMALLVMSLSGAVLSAMFLLQSIARGEARAARAGWIWGVLFAGSSFVAAYCFGRLLWEA